MVILDAGMRGISALLPFLVKLSVEFGQAFSLARECYMSVFSQPWGSSCNPRGIHTSSFPS